MNLQYIQARFEIAKATVNVISDHVIKFYETIFTGFSLFDVDFNEIGFELGLE